MKKKLRIPYFPKEIMLITPLFFIGGVYLILSKYPFWGLGGILMGVVVLTTAYVTEINLRSRSYKDYLFFLGFDLKAELKRFNGIDRIIITKGYHKHTVRFPGGPPRIVNWSEFTGVLLFENGELELMTKKDKRKLILALKELAEFLNTEIEDRSVKDSYTIDLTRVK